MSLPLPRSPLPTFGDSSEGGDTSPPVGGHSPLSAASPVSVGGAQRGTLMEQGTLPLPQEDPPAERPGSEDQDFAAFLAGMH